MYKIVSKKHGYRYTTQQKVVEPKVGFNIKGQPGY
jgi:hypothetical protein